MSSSTPRAHHEKEEKKTDAPSPDELYHFFEVCLKNQSVAEMKALLAKDPRLLTCRYNNDDIFKNTPLLQTIAFNQTEKALELINMDKEGTTLALADQYKKGRNTPLLLAMKNGNIAVAKALIERLKPEDLKATDHFGFTPMLWACMLRLNDIIILLKNKGVNVNESIEVKLPPDGEAKKVTGKMLYQCELKETDLSLPSAAVRAESDERFVGTKRPEFSDLHFTVEHVIENLWGRAPKDIDTWVPVAPKVVPLMDDIWRYLPHELKTSSREATILISRNLLNTAGAQHWVNQPEANPHVSWRNEAAKIQLAFLRKFIMAPADLFQDEMKHSISAADASVAGLQSRDQALQRYDDLRRESLIHTVPTSTDIDIPEVDEHKDVEQKTPTFSAPVDGIQQQTQPEVKLVDEEKTVITTPASSDNANPPNKQPVENQQQTRLEEIYQSFTDATQQFQQTNADALARVQQVYNDLRTNFRPDAMEVLLGCISVELSTLPNSQLPTANAPGFFNHPKENFSDVLHHFLQQQSDSETVLAFARESFVIYQSQQKSGVKLPKQP